MSAAKPDRLFCPLTAEAFGWWKSGEKKVASQPASQPANLLRV